MITLLATSYVIIIICYWNLFENYYLFYFHDFCDYLYYLVGILRVNIVKIYSYFECQMIQCVLF